MKRFVFVTAATNSQPSRWLHIWLALAAVAAGAILLSLGLVIALAVVLAAAFLLLPVVVWRLFAASRPAEGPITLEGEYSVVAQTAGDSRDDAPDRPYTGDAGRPSGRVTHESSRDRNAC